MPVANQQLISDATSGIASLRAFIAAKPAPSPAADAADAAILAMIAASKGIVSLPPGTGVKPDATNTGPRLATSRWSGNAFNMTQSVTGAAFSGQVTANVPAGQTVTLTDCLLDAQGSNYAAYNAGQGNLILDHCEIKNSTQAGIYGNGWHAIGCNIHTHQADCTKVANNSILESCWLHDYGINPSAHGDGAQAVNGVGIIIRGNFIDATKAGGHWNNSCIFFNGSYWLIDAPVIQGNWLLGANYPIYLQSNEQNAQITLNTFYPSSYQYGILSNPEGSARPGAWTGNVDDKGAPVALPAPTK